MCTQASNDQRTQRASQALESNPSPARCEMCGALREDTQADGPRHEAADALRCVMVFARADPMACIAMLLKASGEVSQRMMAKRLRLSLCGVQRALYRGRVYWPTLLTPSVAEVAQRERQAREDAARG